MPTTGGSYHSVRNQYEGNWDDGIDYMECARRCAEKSDCAGFDVWYGNNDCELFFDVQHYGDGSKDEECFINLNAEVKGPMNYSEEEWSALFDEFAVTSRGDKYGSYDEFVRGWKS